MRGRGKTMCLSENKGWGGEVNEREEREREKSHRQPPTTTRQTNHHPPSRARHSSTRERSQTQIVHGNPDRPSTASLFILPPPAPSPTTRRAALYKLFITAKAPPTPARIKMPNSRISARWVPSLVVPNKAGKVVGRARVVAVMACTTWLDGERGGGR